MSEMCARCGKEKGKHLIKVSNTFLWGRKEDMIWGRHFKNKEDVWLCSKCDEEWCKLYHSKDHLGRDKAFKWSEAWLIFEKSLKALKETVQFT